MPDPTTPVVGFTLAAAHEAPWDVLTNANWTLADTFFGRCVLGAPSSNQTVTQPGSSYLSVNRLQAFGATPFLAFGASAATFSAGLSMPASATLSVDSSTPGDGNGKLIAAILNAKTGFQLNGAAPMNHFLVGNGTNYVDSASLPGGLFFYQTVQSSGSPQNQRNVLNFISSFTVTDNPGNNSTDVALRNTSVSAGSYTNANITVAADGRITSAANGGAFTYNPVQHDVTGARALSTVYQNTTGTTMRVYGYGTTAGSTVASIEARTGSTGTLTLHTDTIFANTSGATVNTGTVGFAFEVQNGWFYAVYPNTFTNGMGSGLTGLGKWWEVF